MKNKEKNAAEPQEMSLSELILILVKHWKSGAIVFLLFYIIGLAGFVYLKKDVIFFKPKYSGTEIQNQIKLGYTWTYNPVIAEYKVSYDELQPTYPVSLLFLRGDFAKKIQSKFGLICMEKQNEIQFFRNSMHLFSISFTVDNSNRVIRSKMTLPSAKERQSKNFPDNVVLADINNTVTKTLLEILNVSTNSYKKIRIDSFAELSRISLGEIKEKGQLNELVSLYKLTQEFRRVEVPSIRTITNKVSAHPVNPIPEPGMGIKKFLLFYLVIDLFLSMIFVYMLEFISRINLWSQIRDTLKKNQ